MREIKFRAWDKDIPGWVEGISDSDALRLAVAFPKSVTVVQFTGLKDKNGKEIYEGYICRAEFCCEACFDIEPHKIIGEITIDSLYGPLIDIGHVSLPIQNIDGLEIIGNIYENPELLESK